jgi:hypothetical protein
MTKEDAMAMEEKVRPVDRHIEAIKRAVKRYVALTGIAVVRCQTSKDKKDEEAAFRALRNLVQAMARLTRTVAKEDTDTRLKTFLELQNLGSPALDYLITTMRASRDATLRDLCVKGMVAIASASHAGATAAIVEAAADPAIRWRRPVPRAIRKLGELRLKLLKEIMAELMPPRCSVPAGPHRLRAPIEMI